MGSDNGIMTLPLRTHRRATPGALRPPAAMGQAGPALVVAMTTPVTPSGVPVADPLGVPDAKGPHPVVDRPGDHRLSGLVVGLVDAPAVADLPPALGSAELSPSPRPPLAPAGGLSPHPPCPRLGVGEVQVALGPQAPPRHEQGLVSCDHGEGMDDAGVHAGDDTRVQVVVLGL